ncbi:unnamed protein product [Durusdinium trenchii]|uniref:Uncharacterized protein n=1 Tax=Durusdinium trenchii TaxID=1381693 RepID=A0ABP0KU04_9DINO
MAAAVRSRASRTPFSVEQEPYDDAQGFLDFTHQGRHGHRIPWKQYGALAVWFVLLLIQYCVVRVVCQLQIPRDCHPDSSLLEVMYDFQVMFVMGFMLAILTGVHMPDRFAYLFCFSRPKPRGWVFLAVMLLIGPAWGSLDHIEVLSRISFTTDFFKKSVVNCLIGVGVGAFAVFLLGWHFYCACRHNPLSGFLAYTCSRLAIWIFYALYLYVAANTAGVYVHLHHYIIGFLCAILAEFNHPISLLVLAGGTGIFVQGISAYDADPVIERLRLFF